MFQRTPLSFRGASIASEPGIPENNFDNFDWDLNSGLGAFAPPRNDSADSTPQQPLDLVAERRRDVGPRHRIRDVGGEEADLGAAVEALAVELHGVERLALGQRDHRVGDLDLAAGAAGLVRKQVENLRLQDVAP